MAPYESTMKVRRAFVNTSNRFARAPVEILRCVRRSFRVVSARPNLRIAFGYDPVMAEVLAKSGVPPILTQDRE